MTDIIRNIDVWYSACSADHFPVCVDVDMSIVPEVENITNNEANSVKWDTLSGESINQYKESSMYVWEDTHYFLKVKR